MNAKHTPGPWSHTTRRGNWDYVVFCAADPNIEVCQMFHDGTELNERGEANARLIAAAPDLLAELQRVTDLLETWSRDHAEECTAEIDAAIYSARTAITLATK